MCGINGIINLNNTPVDKKTISRMNTLIKHRGPDGDGIYIDENVGFGHVRLSIIDLTNAASQPFISQCGNFVLTYNGEIYNYIELREILRKKGHKFVSTSDTEVLLHSYMEYGSKCLDYLNGMFAFAIFDKQKYSVFIARDRVGIKPFYYYHDNNHFYFSSEIKGLVKSGMVKPEIDHDGLLDYLNFQFPLGNKTLFKNIKQLKPAHHLTIDLKYNNVRDEEYWRLDYTLQDTESIESYKKKLLELLQDSVNIRLRSDVSVGAHLSGGIDSSIITALASSGNLATFTGAFRDYPGYDESNYAKLVSEKFNTQYNEIVPTFTDFKRYMSQIIYHLDYPVVGPGVFPQYMVCKLIHDNNIKVVLGGQGGDEFFGGYTRYIIAYLEQCLKGSICEADKGDFIVTLQSIIPNLPSLQNYVPMLKKFWSRHLFEPMDLRYLDLMCRMDDVDRIVNFKTDYDPRLEFINIFHSARSKSYIDKMLHFDMKTLLLGLLHVEDRTSMAWGIESRVPLLDYRIAEFSTTISPKLKFKDGKTKLVLKEAARNHLPDEIIDRKDKMGFPVPLYEWFSKELKNWLVELLDSDDTRIYKIIKKEYVMEKIKADKKFGREVWGLLCLELWMREFF